MKKNILKKGPNILLLLASVFVPFLGVSVDKVEAADCEQIHTNYYFFVQIAGDDILEQDDGYTTKASTYIEDLKVPVGKEVLAHGQISLNGQTFEGITWDINTYWKYGRQFENASLVEQVDETSIPNATLIGHGTWNNDQTGEVDIEGKADLSGYSESQLVNATYIPTSSFYRVPVETGREAPTSGTFYIQRDFPANSPFTGTPISYTYTVTAYDSVVSPALYYVQYCEVEAEEQEPTPENYKVTIHYIDTDNNTIQADRILGSNYADGSSYTYSCPSTITYNGQTYNFDSSDNVSGRINGADAEGYCIYSLNVPNNPTTGDIAIYAVWLIGAGALIYSIYYFNKNYRKSEM